jgi:hypothetical protein
MIRLTDHFSLEELTASQTAARLGIDNAPDATIAAELRRLAVKLERVRERLGAPILVSSGYRSPALNAAVPGSAPGSAHTFGRAADFTCPGFGTPLDICKVLRAEGGIPFDQLIHEFGAWVHFGIALFGQLPRRQVLTIDAGGTRSGL